MLNSDLGGVFRQWWLRDLSLSIVTMIVKLLVRRNVSESIILRIMMGVWLVVSRWYSDFMFALHRIVEGQHCQQWGGNSCWVSRRIVLCQTSSTSEKFWFLRKVWTAWLWEHENNLNGWLENYFLKSIYIDIIYFGR